MPAEALNEQDRSLYEDDSPPNAKKQGGRLLIRFFYKPFKVLQKGEDGVERFVWEKREMVEMLVPGDRTNAPVKFVTEEMKQRWAAQYAAWKAGEDQTTAGGWPLEKWPGVDVAQVETLKAAKVYTVEHLAGMSDANLGKLGPGWRPVRQAAIDFLEAAKSAAPMAALREENERLKSQQVANERLMAELSERLKKLEAGKPGKEKAA